MRVKLNSKQARLLVERAFPEYKGRKFYVDFDKSVTFHDTNWDGGTRNKYVVLRSDEKQFKFNAPAPWNNNVEGKSFDLTENVVVVEWSMFCGKDCGITIYANPVNAPKLLPAGAAELAQSYELVQNFLKE